ncbi:GNAT family N-acetyltransferase [Sneathiella sp. P13V-1]|uniref:GNAT family N-acetyltransferase n=1 Tax=Sneathiella sp. P13V-1 TaxID=2697366 RepID=UPI00187B5313|nr:GNAT family N-acetyltransferase [Sneathiella sp. P13V-1]MBE7636578.1 GNAT family N-acetyltransferase [Sneathiella sp. P13V-1]
MTFSHASATIRPVQNSDIPAIHRIYEDQVLNGVSSWEDEPPTVQEMTDRQTTITEKGFPYLVAKVDGQVMGYAYASSYRPRPGYRYTVENSIYVDQNARGSGIGRLLMEELIRQCEAAGYRQMVAVIGDSNNHPSINFHKKMGFIHAGTIRSIGFKFGRWMDSVIMQLPLGESDQTLP